MGAALGGAELGIKIMKSVKTIEFDTSAILGKFVVRTKSIKLFGKGITCHHEQSSSKPYNVYSLTSKAFEKVSSQYPAIKLMN
jgi:hypothetical protein